MEPRVDNLRLTVQYIRPQVGTYRVSTIPDTAELAAPHISVPKARFRKCKKVSRNGDLTLHDDDISSHVVANHDALSRGCRFHVKYWRALFVL